MAYTYRRFITVTMGHYEKTYAPHPSGIGQITGRKWVADPSRTAEVEVTIDTDRLAETLGYKACKSSRSLATTLYGIVKVKEIKREVGR